MVEKKRVEQAKPRTRTRAELEDMLAMLLEERAEQQREAPGVARTKPTKPGKPKRLQKRTVEGTGSIFWEVHKPMTIRQADADNGRYYKAADGKRIRVFFVNKNFPQAPIVGALEIQPGVWDSRVWNYDGGMRTPYGHGSNIVGFWEE